MDSPSTPLLLDRRGWRWMRADPAALVVATLFALVAMTPSLLPRTWLFQALVSGISAAAGYGLGRLVLTGLRHWGPTRRAGERVRAALPAPVRRAARPALLVVLAAALVLGLVLAADGQREVRSLIGEPGSSTAGWLRAAPALVVVAALLVLAGRGVRAVARAVARVLRRRVRLPRRVAALAGAVVTVVVVVGVVQGVVVRAALAVADAAFSVANEGTPEGVVRPSAPERSGSAESLAPWDSLGSEGRVFVAGGPSAERIAEAADVAVEDVVAPVRAYIGLESAGSAQERAALAVRELERSGGFDREVLVLITTTGTGWVNESAPDALELVHGGDTAIVATQYSYLPSWLSFLVDRSRAAEAGRELFDAVHERVEALPEAERPRLLVYGESLGSAGSEAAFSGLTDARARTDGVLWVGPPNSNELWSSLVEQRDPGSPEVDPVYDGGMAVRFGAGAEDLLRPEEEWATPRVVYLQHATDPIVWWSPALLFFRPDWLVQPRGEGVSPAVRWYPVVTFWQVTADMVNAEGSPDGFGHHYGDALLDAWVLIAPPEGWTAADTDRARALLA